jgi:hypothetical protein
MNPLKAVVVSWLIGPLAAAGLDLKVTPQVVEMGAFYNGAKIRIEYLSEPDAKPVVLIKGSEVHELFNVKGRAGPIWVNAGKVTISGVPSLYLSMSPQAVSDFLQPEAVDRYMLDLIALKGQIRIEPPEMDSDVLRTEYLKLKSNEKSYRFINDAVKVGEASKDGVPYVVDLEWPRNAPPGDYEVVVYEFRNGSIAKELHAPLKADRVGFPAFMASLANKRAELYGVLCVVLAVLAGFGMDSLVAALRRKGKGGSPSGEAPAGH